jgi:carbon storage regulator
MLVLSRRVNQQVVIGDNIELVVVAVNGDRVRLGFSAPGNVPIHREEVHRRMQSEDCRTDAKTCDASHGQGTDGVGTP